ncbi:MAG TPA: invasin domain 3-containing protein, partial [Candidatus Cybelea sp.]
IPLEELRSRFGSDPAIVERLSDRDPNNLDYIPVEAAEITLGRHLMVDPATRKLVPKPKLQIKAKKAALAGDGLDSTELEISTVDAQGRHVGLSGKVKVATTRGKLSARGGIVELKDGRASLTLTSANETAGSVHVSVTPLDRAYAAARLDVEFV